MSTALVADLTDAECGALVEHERIIERGLKTFVEVGRALAAIRDGQLYRTEYASFEAYCDQRWAISRPRAYQLMAAAEVVSTTVDSGYRPPANEAQARELGRVAEDERTDVWREANERSNGRPTAATIREVVRERREPPPSTSGQGLPPDDVMWRPAKPGETPGQMEPEAKPEPARPAPPKWDPEERRRHELEVRRIQDIKFAKQAAETIVAQVQALVVTVVTGSRYGEKGLVTPDMIRDLRSAIDLLERELDHEE